MHIKTIAGCSFRMSYLPESAAEATVGPRQLPHSAEYRAPWSAEGSGTGEELGHWGAAVA